MSKLQSLLSWIGSRVRLSFLSALAGWGVGSVLVLLLAIRTFLFGPASQTNPLFFALVFCAIMGVFVFITWIALLIPLSLLVRMKSAFWDPAILTAIGAITGPLVMLLYALWERHGSDIHYASPSAQWNDYLVGAMIFGVPASIVGGVTGYVAAILNRRH